MLVGAGSLGAAVAMVGRDGDYYMDGVKGVIRLTQVHPMYPYHSHLFRWTENVVS